MTKCEPLVGPVAGSVPGVDDEAGQFEGGVEIAAPGGERGELGPGEGDDPAVADRHALLHRLFEHRRRPARIERFDGDRSGVERRRQRGGVADALGEAQRLLRQRPALLGSGGAREPDRGHVEGVDETGIVPARASGSDHALAHGGRLGAAAPVVEDVAHRPPVEAARGEPEVAARGRATVRPSPSPTRGHHGRTVRRRRWPAPTGPAGVRRRRARRGWSRPR